MRFAAENKSAASHFYYAMKTEELQLFTFCDDWENVEARVLCTTRACVETSNLIDIATKEKYKMSF